MRSKVIIYLAVEPWAMHLLNTLYKPLPGCFLQLAGSRKLTQSLEGEGSCLFLQNSSFLPQVLIVLGRDKILFAWLEIGPLLVNNHKRIDV